MPLDGWDPATRVERFNAYVADWLLILVVCVVLALVLQTSRLQPLLIAYLLCRDVAGRSPGKRSGRLFIRTSAGTPPARWQLIVRNVPLVVAPLLSGFPAAIIGVGGLVGLADLLAFFLTGRRLGDRLADTWVVTAKPSPFAV